MTAAALKPATHDIIVDEVFPHSPETVWKVVSDGRLMARWIMEPTGFAPIVGNRFTFRTTPAGAWDGIIRCEVLEVKRGERLVFDWRGGDKGNSGYGSLLDTVVSLTLSKAETGTRLRLVHSGFVLPVNESAYQNMSKGWVVCLGRIHPVVDEEEG